MFDIPLIDPIRRAHSAGEVESSWSGLKGEKTYLGLGCFHREVLFISCPLIRKLFSNPLPTNTWIEDWSQLGQKEREYALDERNQTKGRMGRLTTIGCPQNRNIIL